MSAPAPVVLLAWRRPEHLRRVLDALAANPEARDTDVTAFCDGPRDPSQAIETDSVIKVLEGAGGFRSLRIVRRDGNVGLSRNVVSGVSEIVEAAGRAIVLEDDLLASPAFLGWMNRALDLYAETPEVASVHGYWYPVDGAPDSFFLRGADCWGWGVWKRSWDLFEADGTRLLAEIERRNLAWEFDMDGSFPYLDMLRDQIAGRNDSWAIRWHASAFLAGMVTLFPGRSLVANIGTDGSGANHTQVDTRYETMLSPAAPPLERIEPREDSEVFRRLARYHARGTGRDTWRRTLRNLSRRILNRKGHP